MFLLYCSPLQIVEALCVIYEARVVKILRDELESLFPIYFYMFPSQSNHQSLMAFRRAKMNYSRAKQNMFVAMMKWIWRLLKCGLYFGRNIILILGHFSQYYQRISKDCFQGNQICKFVWSIVSCRKIAKSFEMLIYQKLKLIKLLPKAVFFL